MAELPGRSRKVNKGRTDSFGNTQHSASVLFLALGWGEEPQAERQKREKKVLD